MIDSLNLREYYDRVSSQMALYLSSQFGAEKWENKINNLKYPHAYLIKLNINQKAIEIIVVIPNTFPDTFPKVYLSDNSFQKIYPIPHLNKDKSLCIFDESVTYPNPDKPQGVIDLTLKKAKELIRLGVEGANSGDFFDEFESYWGQESRGEILSLIELSDVSKEILMISFEKKSWISRVLITDNQYEGVEWLTKAGANIGTGRCKALYIPLRGIGNPPFPKTNRELLIRLKQESPESIKNIKAFLKQNPRPSTIVFSIPHQNGKVLAAWQHDKMEKFVRLKYRGKGYVQTTIKGFRSGKPNVCLELMRDFKDTPIKKFILTRVDQERLHFRGGEGSKRIERSVALIGCGSIGSHLLSSIIDMETNKILLVDPDELTFGNIARHVCGASDVGRPKVKALEQKLTSHYPSLTSISYQKEILQLLCDLPEILHSYDLIIVALGNFPIESRLNRMIQRGQLESPMLFVWVEPYLAGGHALYVQPGKKGCLSCLFSDDGRFINAVLDNPGQYQKKEAGCQSVFAPYSVLEVKRYINDLTFFIEEIQHKKIQENMLFTWIGNTKAQRKAGRKIAVKWSGANSYSTRVKLISNYQCKECSEDDL